MVRIKISILKILKHNNYVLFIYFVLVTDTNTHNNSIENIY